MFTRASSLTLRLLQNTMFAMSYYGSNSGAAEDSLLTGFYVVYAFIFRGQTVFTEAINVQQNDSPLRYP